MRPIALVIFLTLAPATLVSCQSTQPAVQEVISNPREKLAYVEISYQAALRIIDSQINAGVITGERATKVLALVTKAEAALIVARAVVSGSSDATSIGGAIAAYTAIVVQLTEATRGK